eukprot:scaffold1877_cov140-Isochrysis_galbana.AAC.8
MSCALLKQSSYIYGQHTGLHLSSGFMCIRKNSARAWRDHDAGAAPASSFGWSPQRWSRPRTKVLRLPA